MTNDKADLYKAAALFINDEGKLLVSRDIGVTKWTILGGVIEKGETQIGCLHREIMEELGAKIEVNQKMYKEAPAYPAANDPGKTVKHYYYFCKFLTEFKPVSEVELLHWLSKKDFESKEFGVCSALYQSRAQSDVTEGRTVLIVCKSKHQNA